MAPGGHPRQETYRDARLAQQHTLYFQQRLLQLDWEVNQICDAFSMSLLGGGFQAGPWFQDLAAWGAFGILAPRFDWIPAWFSFQSSPRTKEEIDDNKDQLAQELDRRIKENSFEDTASDDDEAQDAASQKDPIRLAALRRERTARNIKTKRRFVPCGVRNIFKIWWKSCRHGYRTLNSTSIGLRPPLIKMSF